MKYVFVQPTYGLCNRMRTIVGANELAKKLNRKLVVLWVRDKDLNAKFSDLFKDLDCLTIETQEKSILLWMLWKIIIHIFRSKVIFDNWIQENVYNTSVDWINQLNNSNIFINSCYDIIHAGDYGIFQVRNSVLGELPVSHSSKKMIGIHIRRTDNEMSIKHSPTCLFEKKIQEEIGNDPTAIFYLSTDSSMEEQKLIETFGEKINIFKKTSLDRNNPTAIKEALIDLYNLSQCKKIYGSYYSSFSSTAALWGNIPKEEIFV